MNNIKLSFCIGTYNQGGMLRENIRNILFCLLNNIEIVVSDNNSEEDIESIVKEFHDPRVRYIRLQENVGQDLNLINGMKYCNGEYIMILRTKDSIYPCQVERIIEYLDEFPEAGYFLFSANDELDKKRLYFNEMTYKKGKDALASIENLIAHPSGPIYRRSLLNLDLYEKFLLSNFDNHKSFIVDELIRIHLACIGDFRLSSNVFWKYAVTERSKIKSQLSEGEKIDLHAPQFEYPRFRCELMYCNSIIPDEWKIRIMKRTIIKWFRKITFNYKFRNKNVQMLNHYGTIPINFNCRQEKRKFFKYTVLILKPIEPKLRNILMKTMFLEFVYSYTFFPLSILRTRVISKIKRIVNNWN